MNNVPGFEISIEADESSHSFEGESIDFDALITERHQGKISFSAKNVKAEVAFSGNINIEVDLAKLVEFAEKANERKRQRRYNQHHQQ